MSGTKGAKNTTGTPPQTQGTKQGGGKQGGGNTPCKNSFSADTSVATTEGDVPISAIEIGDIVLAYNEATGVTGVYTVTDTMAHVDPQVVLLTIGTEDIETTPEHPFFTLERRWVHAADLRVGDHVRRLGGGSEVVARIALVVRPQLMYNLSVATRPHVLRRGRGVAGA